MQGGRARYTAEAARPDSSGVTFGEGRSAPVGQWQVAEMTHWTTLPACSTHSKHSATRIQAEEGLFPVGKEHTYTEAGDITEGLENAKYWLAEDRIQGKGQMQGLACQGKDLWLPLRPLHKSAGMRLCVTWVNDGGP